MDRDLPEIGVNLFYRWAQHEAALDEETRRKNREMRAEGRQRLITVEELKAQVWVETRTVHPWYCSVLMVKAEVSQSRLGHA